MVLDRRVGGAHAGVPEARRRGEGVARARNGIEEGAQLRGILASRGSLGSARGVHRVRMRQLDRLGDVLGVQPAAQNQRNLRAARAQQRPIEALPRAASQSLALPARSRARRAGGSRCESAPGRGRRRGPRPAAALITRAPVRRAASAQNDGPSSPWNCNMLSPRSSLVATTSSSGAFTNTPHSSTLRRSAATIRCASAGEQRRGLPS